MEISISRAVAVLRREGLIPSTRTAAIPARRNLSNWLAHGLVRGRKVEHQTPTGEISKNDKVWLVDEDELLAAWREGRIPPQVGRPQKAAHPQPG